MTATTAATSNRAALLENGIPVAICLIALPIMLVATGELGGWLVGTGLFILNRGVAWGIDRSVRDLSETAKVGAQGFGNIARGLGSFGLLFAANAIWGKQVAAGAAILFLVVFTVDFGVRLIAQQTKREAERRDQEVA